MYLIPKSDHEIVPNHDIMSEAEVKALCEKMNIRLDNLPKIFTTDPQAVKLGAKSGQVIKIMRKEGKNEYPYYRIVVEA